VRLSARKLLAECPVHPGEGTHRGYPVCFDQFKLARLDATSDSKEAVVAGDEVNSVGGEAPDVDSYEGGVEVVRYPLRLFAIFADEDARRILRWGAEQTAPAGCPWLKAAVSDRRSVGRGTYVEEPRSDSIN